MKSIFTKILSSLLALIVLISTFSFTVDKHYCGEFLVDVSYTGKAEGCGMNVEGMSPKMKNCCKDEIQQIEGQDELQQVSIQNFTLEKQQFLVSFISSYQNLFVEVDEQIDFFKDFSPPNIPQDYQSLYQVYVI